MSDESGTQHVWVDLDELMRGRKAGMTHHRWIRDPSGHLRVELVGRGTDDTYLVLFDKGRVTDAHGEGVPICQVAEMPTKEPSVGGLRNPEYWCLQPPSYIVESEQSGHTNPVWAVCARHAGLMRADTWKPWIARITAWDFGLWYAVVDDQPWHA